MVDVLDHDGIDVNYQDHLMQMGVWQRGKNVFLDGIDLPMSDRTVPLSRDQIKLLKAAQTLTDAELLVDRFSAAESWEELRRVAALAANALVDADDGIERTERISRLIRTGTEEDGDRIQELLREFLVSKAGPAIQTLERLDHVARPDMPVQLLLVPEFMPGPVPARVQTRAQS